VRGRHHDPAFEVEVADGEIDHLRTDHAEIDHVRAGLGCAEHDGLRHRG
jgi:hypothetical protein